MGDVKEIDVLAAEADAVKIVGGGGEPRRTGVPGEQGAVPVDGQVADDARVIAGRRAAVVVRERLTGVTVDAADGSLDQPGLLGERPHQPVRHGVPLVLPGEERLVIRFRGPGDRECSAEVSRACKAGVQAGAVGDGDLHEIFDEVRLVLVTVESEEGGPVDEEPPHVKVFHYRRSQ